MGTNHFKDLNIDNRIILKGIIKKQGGWMSIIFFWLRIGISGVLLQKQ
jgi:hypothetical protein